MVAPGALLATGTPLRQEVTMSETIPHPVVETEMPAIEDHKRVFLTRMLCEIDDDLAECSLPCQASTCSISQPGGMALRLRLGLLICLRYSYDEHSF